MARRVVSNKEARRSRLYGSVLVLRDGRVRFSAEPGPVRSLDFSVQRHHWEEPDVWVYDSERYGIDVRRNGEATLLLFVKRSRVWSACFSYILTPEALRRAVADVRKHGNGVERWLAPALIRTQYSLTKLGSNPALLAVIPKLLRSVRDLPVADEWRRQLRNGEQAWRRWREQNPAAPSTGHPMDPRKARSAGDDTLVSKPGKPHGATRRGRGRR
jgi:hypothetical protein